MAINPDTGEYTGNDLERLEEALDKFLCLGPVYATWRRLRTQDSNVLIPSFTIEYQNLQGYCEHVSLMADDELSPVPGAAIILAENILITAIRKGIKQLGELQLSKENIARILWVARWCKQQLLEKDWESSDRAKLRHLEAANRDIYAAEMYQYQAVLKRLENNPPYNP